METPSKKAWMDARPGIDIVHYIFYKLLNYSKKFPNYSPNCLIFWYKFFLLLWKHNFQMNTDMKELR